MSNFTFSRLDKDAANKPDATKYDNIALTYAELIQEVTAKKEELSSLGTPDADVELEVRPDYWGLMNAKTTTGGPSELEGLTLVQATSTSEGAGANVGLAIQALEQHLIMLEGFASSHPSGLPVAPPYFENGTADVFTETTTAKNGKDFLSALNVKGIQSCEDINVHGDIILSRNEDSSAAEEFRFTELVQEVQLVHGFFMSEAGDLIENFEGEPETELEGSREYFQPMDPVTSREIRNWTVTNNETMHNTFQGDDVIDYDRTDGASDVNASPSDSIAGVQLDGQRLVPKADAEASSPDPDQGEGLTVDLGLAGGGSVIIPLQHLKWYLRLVKADGKVFYREFKPVNDLVTGAGEFGSVYSVMAGMQDIKDLQDAARYMFAELGLASIAAIDALELKMTNDLYDLMLHLNHVEQQLADHIKSEDLRISGFYLNRIDDLSDEIHDLEEAIRFSGIATLPDGAAAGDPLSFIAELDEKMGDSDLECWKIDAGIIVNSVREGDLEAQFEARKIDLETDSSAPARPAIQIQVFTGGCELESEDSTFEVAVNAIYAGSIASSKVVNNLNGDSTSAQANPELPLALNSAIDGADDQRKIDCAGTAGVECPDDEE